MATLSWYQLVIEGPATLLARFRGDESIWRAEPWSSVYRAHVREDDVERGRLVYQYADDYKHEAPSVADMAASYPKLTLTCEVCDEFGTVAGRTRYVGGVKAEAMDVDPLSLTGWSGRRATGRSEGRPASVHDICEGCGSGDRRSASSSSKLT
jgi:hypothetical protein